MLKINLSVEKNKHPQMKGVKFMIVDFTCVRKLFTPGVNPKSNITTQLPISRWEAFLPGIAGRSRQFSFSGKNAIKIHFFKINYNLLFIFCDKLVKKCGYNFKIFWRSLCYIVVLSSIIYECFC